MSYEVRTGLLALVAIALSLWGIKYIQGTNLLSKSDTYYAFYNDVSGVTVGTPVQISGVTVGSVSARELNTEDRRVKLTFTLERNVPLPKNTRAALVAKSFLGEMAIVFDYDAPCSGDNCAQSGDTFVGISRGMVESMLGEGGLTTYIDQLKNGLKEVADSLNQDILGEDSTGPLAESARDLQATMSNLKDATGRMNLLLQRSSPALERTLANVASLTSTLEGQQNKIASIISNADSLSQQMVDAQLGQAVQDAKQTIVQLNETLAVAQTALGGVNEMIGNLKKGEGTLGLLLQDEALYNNLNTMSYSLDSLLTDLQDKPYRYLPLKSRRKVKRFDKLDNADQ
jgi:phospholipid/cholesterol/gamma-HCH transport system substrate-binding protein